MLGRLDLRTLARLHLQALVRETGETATLSAPGEHDAITVDFAHSSSVVQSVAQLGRPSVGHATAAGKVTITVKGGNAHALKLLIGQPADQTFTTGPETVFLHWAQRIPTVIDASGLKVGDQILIRVRAARGLSLAEVEATPARRVADREPKAQESHQNNQS